jgi:hypothetical protein
MPARILIETPEDHAAWVLSQTPAAASLEPKDATQLGGMP